MVQLYYKLITEGVPGWTIERVPEKYRAEVEALLEAAPTGAA